MATVIVSTNVTASGTAVALASNTLTYVLQGVTVISTTGSGAVSATTSDNVDLRVDGTLYGEARGALTQSNGTGGQHSLTVGATGRVIGNRGFGAEIEGANGSVLNLGEISVSFGTGLSMQGAGGTVVNHGLISSMSANSSNNEGVQIVADGVRFQNFGTVVALGVGSTGVDALSQVGGRIENYGTISGVSTSIVTGAANDVVVNAGRLVGDVVLNAGDDRFDGSEGLATTVFGGTGFDRIVGGTGDDRFFGGSDADTLSGRDGDDTLGGEAGADTLRGGGGDDRLDGGGEADTLSGGGGDDTLVGGFGADMLIGGADADTFLFFAGDTGTAGLADSIADFRSGIDRVDVTSFALTAFIGNAAFGAVAGELRYDRAAGRLEGDLDGDGAAEFAIILQGAPKLVVTDLIL